MDNIILGLHIVLSVLVSLFILLSLFKQSSAQEALSSISGGSQRLFAVTKVKLSKSVLMTFLIFFATLIVVFLIVLRVLINVSSS